MDQENNQAKKTPAKLLGTIALTVAILSIPLAFLLDVIAFKDVILQFIAALIFPCIAFVFFCVLFIASIILIFGIYLIKEYGFWPLTLSWQFFKEILGDIKVTQAEVDTFRGFRILLLIICFSVLIVAIIANILAKKDKEAGLSKVYRSAKGTSKAATILAILGILVSVAALVLTSNL